MLQGQRGHVFWPCAHVRELLEQRSLREIAAVVVVETVHGVVDARHDLLGFEAGSPISVREGVGYVVVALYLPRCALLDDEEDEAAGSRWWTYRGLVFQPLSTFAAEPPP